MDPKRISCFIAQPFDKGKFDKRYADVVKPTIESCQLTPYRVDDDHDKEDLLKAIEEGIAAATVVFVDISEDNPNVWLELGVAKALGKPLVLACCQQDRPGKLPFDISVKRVCFYSSESAQDFAAYGEELAKHVTAAMRRGQAKEVVAEMSSADRIDNLSPQEIAILIKLIEFSPISDGTGYDYYSMAYVMERRGYTELVVSIATARLQRRGFIWVKKERSQNDPEEGMTLLIHMTDEAITWMLDHEEELVRQPKLPAKSYRPPAVEEPPF